MSDCVQIPVCLCAHAQDLPLPRYATQGSAGLDLLAACSHILAPQSFALIPTGLMLALPRGYEAQVRSRSGLASKDGVVVLNAPGTIDSDFRGEIQVLLMNHGHDSYAIHRGDRIAQLVIARFERIVWDIKASLESTERGEKGFGSTGRFG